MITEVRTPNINNIRKITDFELRKLGVRGELINVDYKNRFRKTNEEKAEVSQAKKQHKESLKNPIVYKSKVDALLSVMLNSNTPKWGSIEIKLIKH